VNFTVSKTGKIDKVSILKKINDLLDAEAVRVVSSMPNWTPGENKDIPVDVEMTLPINFKLD
jgi:protein TonB